MEVQIIISKILLWYLVLWSLEMASESNSTLIVAGPLKKIKNNSMSNLFPKNQLRILVEWQQRKAWVPKAWLCFLILFNVKDFAQL